MAQEMVGTRLPLMCVEVYGELREPDPQKGIVSSKTGFLGRTGFRPPWTREELVSHRSRFCFGELTPGGSLGRTEFHYQAVTPGALFF